MDVDLQLFNDYSKSGEDTICEVNKIADTIDETYKLPIKINDNPACTVNDIRLETKMLNNLGLIVVDYL